MSGAAETMDFSGIGRLDGRAAVVTGAGNGIGRAIALCFAQRGANVFCVDIDAQAAARCADEIVRAGGQGRARACDVAMAAQVDALMAEAAAQQGGLKVLVNNAASFPPVGTILELAPSDWERAFAVNIAGVLLTCRAAIPHMKAEGGGSIVNVASQLASVGAPGRAVYSSTKAAVVQLSRSLALDHSRDRIRVNSLSPGPVASDRIIARYGTLEHTDARFQSACPIGRAGRPAEIARAALFLACDDSSFVTGADLVVDGGFTAQ